MEKEQFEQLLGEMRKQETLTTGDWFMRIAVGVCTTTAVAIGGFIWGMNARIDDLGKQASTLTIRQEVTNAQLEKVQIKLDNFSSEPRFTAENFKAAIQPTIQKVERNAEEISIKRSWVSRMEPIVLRNQQELIDARAELRLLQGDVRDLQRARLERARSERQEVENEQ